MKKPLLQSVFVLLLALAAGSAFAQIAPKAYAPENLRTLSVQDQTRVISLEYSEQSRGRRIPDDQLRFYLDQVNRSNWTFSRIKQDIAQSLGGNSGGWNPNPPTHGQTILCESKSGDARRCTPPWRGQSRLVRQISNSRCEEGATWSSQDGLITVWKGCRGEFAPPAWPSGARSAAKATMAAAAPAARRGAAIHAWSGSCPTPPASKGAAGNRSRARSMSATAAVPSSVRAPVAVAASSQYSVTCSSEDNRRKTCAYDPRQGRPILLQQISNTSCREGYSWGYAGNQIWVDRGCRGRFGPR